VKLRADEHVSIEIVRAVRGIALSVGWELSHVVEAGDRGATDEHWATKFARAGGEAILTGDTDFFRRPHLVAAINRAGLRVIHMPPKWANARCELQAAHILLWWRRIEKQLEAMSPRECYRPPWNINETGELLKVKVDYHEANKRVKRDQKRPSPKAANNVTPIGRVRPKRG
jgi:PIN like domain